MLARGMERQFRPPFFRQTQIDRRSRQIRQIARRIVAELRPVVNAAGRLPVGLRNQAVGRRASSVIKLKLPYLSI